MTPQKSRLLSSFRSQEPHAYFNGALQTRLTLNRREGITHERSINNVQLGPTDTDMNPASGDFAKQARKYIALQHYAHADEIADFVAYLASPGASFITGANLAVNGGLRSVICCEQTTRRQKRHMIIDGGYESFDRQGGGGKRWLRIFGHGDN